MGNMNIKIFDCAKEVKKDEHKYKIDESKIR